MGDVLAGKYRVEQIVGAGAMGTIVAAWHLELEQRVAMKFLHSLRPDGGDPTERFRREARALARIKSEHVARVLDVGSLEGGMPYMVMEFLEGNDLAHEIRARGPLPVVEAVAYMLQALDAMAEAHAAGIVHRDLKPANLFLSLRPDGDRVIKVLDFGISKSLLGISRDQVALTQTASLLGSPLYMSPEQVRSARDVDMRADIWSLGVILYEMLTGRTPYDGDSVAQLFHALLYENAAPVAQLRPDVPRELDAVVMHCLAKDRDQRWRNVGDLAAALLPFGPATGHMHVDRARRVLGSSSDIARPSILQTGVPSGGAQGAGSRPSIPHGGPPFAPGTPSSPSFAPASPSFAPGTPSSPSFAPGTPSFVPASPTAPNAETGPTVNSWSNSGHPVRTVRNGARVALAIAVGALLAGASLGALFFLRSGLATDQGQPPAAAAAPTAEATAAPSAEATAKGDAHEAPGATGAAPDVAGGSPAPTAPAASSSAPAPPPAASSSPAAHLSAPPAQTGAPRATATARPVERSHPGAGARPEPTQGNSISDFGGRR
ncbi:serine/threonine-protein kinase [Sorangium atrum]|uniref:Protein kinase n=1 Tax=Sorangium atrum TaxID=2995308 RepID=A0ABT5CC36_9BACT|nr:serine/threonine-protein kinase [Sorangium aterium]MDC0683380.1 protein kinase [Sorangium aterium]